MNYPYGSRAERDDRERRALRDSRDQRHGDQHDDRFTAAGGRQSQSRDNEYRFDGNRGHYYGGGESGSGRESRTDDDFYHGRGGQSDWSSRSYPQQGSFERAGYDSEREFWEGQGSPPRQYNPGRFGSRRPENPSGRFSESGGGSSGPHGQHDFSQPSGDRYNYWEHGSAGGYQPERRRQPHPSDNYWQHGGRLGADHGSMRAGYHDGGYQGGSYGYPSGHEGEHYEGGGYMRGQMGGAARNRPRKGYTRSDERLREDICERLMHSPFIDAGEVSVEVKEGKVTLEGSVPERSMKHRIEDIAEECSGVKDVDNRVRVARDQGEHGGWGGSGSGASGSTGASGASSGSAHTSTSKSK